MMATRVGLAYGTIVQQAAALADQGGFDALSMATLASHLGVSTPALYHYFAGLAGLRRDTEVVRRPNACCFSHGN